MHFQDTLTRLLEFHRRHGLRLTASRVFASLYRILRSNRTVLFYCDIGRRKPSEAIQNCSWVIERRTSQSELSPQEVKELEESWNPSIMRRLIAERFQRGALLWIAKSEGRLAGYGWTLNATTMEPHFFPLGIHDVHLFDFCVFTAYRGRRINPSLVGAILDELAADGKSRAFIEVKEWNHAQLSSLTRTPFQPLALALRFRIVGKTFVLWSAAPFPPPLEVAQKTIAGQS